MIKDNLDHLAYYNYLNPDIKTGLRYVRDTNFDALEDGRHEIVEGKIYANIQSYETKPEAECKFEAHRKYVDIQFMINGEEKMGTASIDDFDEIEPYREEKDVVFLSCKEEKKVNIKVLHVREKEFAVFYPQDAHMPCIAIENPKFVRKVIVKVLL
jgi:biofilm protein TabA